jgi:hypothetical protein
MVAKEMGRFGVTCNCIRPNAGTRLSLSDDVKAAWTRTGMAHAIQHLEGLSPDDIGPLVAWLASDGASHVNGRVFHVQSGRISLYSDPVEETTITAEGPWLVEDVFSRMASMTAGLMGGTGAASEQTMKAPRRN